MTLDEAGDERRYVDGVAHGLVAARVYQVAKHVFGVLNAATLWILVAQEYLLALLACPETTNAFAVELKCNGMNKSAFIRAVF